MRVYSETVVWSAPEELAAEAPYQLVLVDLPEGGRQLGRMAPGERVDIGDTVALDAVTNGVPLYRKIS